MIKQIVRNISCCDQKYFHSPAKFLYQLLGSGGDVAGEVDGVNALEDDVVGLHGVGAGEGRGPGQQLEHEDAEAPVVSRDVVALVEDNLGRHVLGGPAEGPRLATHLKLLGEAKVHQLDVAGGVEQEVLGLQVPASNLKDRIRNC